jgi:hypothetical protein
MENGNETFDVFFQKLNFPIVFDENNISSTKITKENGSCFDFYVRKDKVKNIITIILLTEYTVSEKTQKSVILEILEQSANQIKNEITISIYAESKSILIYKDIYTEFDNKDELFNLLGSNSPLLAAHAG